MLRSLITLVVLLAVAFLAVALAFGYVVPPGNVGVDHVAQVYHPGIGDGLPGPGS